MKRFGVEDIQIKTKSNILSTAKEALREIRINKNRKYQKKTQWFYNEVKEKCREKKRAYLEYMYIKYDTASIQQI